MQQPDDHIRQEIAEIYRKESRYVFATLIHLLDDFDLAEDALHDAFNIALEQWPRNGVPTNARAWLVSTGRFKAIDRMRRQSKFNPLQIEHLRQLEVSTPESPENIDKELDDDVLRLIFTCCHPALALETRTALTLREVCSLTTEEIARAFLVTPPTIAQRIVRGKAKIREAKILRMPNYPSALAARTMPVNRGSAPLLYPNKAPNADLSSASSQNSKYDPLKNFLACLSISTPLTRLSDENNE